MDLYRVLRISIYLLVAAGAFADSVAEENAVFLIGVLVFGGIAYLTVDSRRIKPVRIEFASAMALALLVYTLLHLRDGTDDEWKHFPSALAHFLCALQVLLFFTPFRGPLLLVFCGSTLGVVVLSGVIKSDITLIGRLICFVTITSWTLFVHSLWRAREAFQARTVAGSGSAESRGPDRTLSERVFWQELAMTGGLSAVCLLLGMLLYVFSPHINERLAGFLGFFHSNLTAPGEANESTGIGWDDPLPPRFTGPTPRVTLDQWTQILQDSKPALRVKFSPLPKELADADGRLLLRQGALGEFNMDWIQPAPAPTPKEPSRSITDPSLSGPVYKGAEFKETILQNLQPAFIRQYPVAGELQRIVAANVDLDEEGAISVPKGETYDYAELYAAVPPGVSQVGDDIQAIHERISRYALNTILPEPSKKRLRELANQITTHKASPKQQVLAIVAWLRDPHNCTYTLRLDELKASKTDAIERFLLNPDPRQRRGHCVYFASAFVLLCRLNNLPARLATGFAVDFPTAGDDGSATVTFLNANAHAWGEVYFKGVGWVAFDPTPHAAPEPPPPVMSGPTLPPIPPPLTGPRLADKSGGVDQWWDSFIHLNGKDQRDMYEWIEGEIGGAGTVLSGEAGVGWGGAIVAWVLVLGLLSVLVYAFLRRSDRRLILGGGGVRRTRAAVAFYNDLLQVLSRRGYVRRPGQTPREFAELVMKRGGAEFLPVMTVTEIFESVRYGNVDVSQDEFNALQKALDRLKELTFGNKP